MARIAPSQRLPRSFANARLESSVSTTLAMFVALLLAVPLVPAAGPPPSADLRQCENGPPATPANPCAWINGNLNENNAHFTEGQSVPYRLVIKNLAPGSSHSVTIGFDITHSSKHALDYLTHFQRISETVNPCIGVTPCALTDTEPIPAPTGTPQPLLSFNALPPNERLMSMYQGTIQSVAYLTQGNHAAAQSQATVRILFTAPAAGDTVVLAWGGHIASSIDWGAGNAASGISGSPYHTSIIDLDGSGGGQDRSLKASAVTPVVLQGATLTLVKRVTNDDGGTKVPSDFSIHLRNATAEVAGSPQPGSATGSVYVHLPAGSYVVSEDAVAGYALNITGDCAPNGTIQLAEGDSKTCTLLNDDVRPRLRVVKTVVNDDGGTATGAGWALYVGTAQVQNATYTGFAAGPYVVSEVGLGGYNATIGGACDASGNVVLAVGDEKTCTIVNDDIRPRLKVTKIVVNDDGGDADVEDFPLFVDGVAIASGIEAGFRVGTHVVTETNLAGYSATFGGDCDARGNVTLAPGDVKACTITNRDVRPLLTVTKVVVNDNNGTATVTDADLFVDGDPVDSGVQNGFSAGIHNVTEAGPTGYQPTFSGDCDENGTVALAVGDVKDCLITNDDVQPMLIVTKVVVNDDGGTLGVADFALFIDGVATASGRVVGVDAGRHWVSETGSSAYRSTITGDCDAQGGVDLSVGDVKRCTITNDDIQPLLVVRKVVTNDHGGQATVSDFSIWVNETSVLSNESHGFPAGRYTVTESGPFGYAAAYGGDCDARGNVSLSAGDRKTCTITNDDIQPLLTVTKRVVNDNGGTSEAGDWTLFVNATQVDSGEPNAFDQGPYRVTESGPAGYAGSFSGDCDAEGDVILFVGDSKDCTVTNNDTQPTLTVVKVVVNDDGGDAAVTAWTLYVDGGQVANGTPYPFDAGRHAVSELGLGGYAAAFSGDCDADGLVTLAVGRNATCVVTNDDIRPRLNVTKLVINDDGGTATRGDFPLFVGTVSVASGVEASFRVGTHIVSETARYGYAATFGGDCDETGSVSLIPGDVKACTVTNDDIEPRLTVVKMIVNDDGGTAVVADAALFVDGVPVESGEQNGFGAGGHNVTEQGPPGYAPTFGGDCDRTGRVELLVGDVKTCIITNDDIRPILTVTKIVVNDNGGAAGPSQFPLFVGSIRVDSGAPMGFNATTHRVSEESISSYSSSIAGDCDAEGNVTLRPGDVASCTITNDDIQPRLTVVKRVINDNGGEAVVGDFALFVNGTSVLSGDPHGFDAGLYQVSESGVRGYAVSFDGDCDANGTIALDVGEDKTCIVVNDDIQPRLTVVKVVINDDGSTGLVSDWKLYVNATEVVSGAAQGFDAGSYIVQETGPTGFAASFAGDCAPDGRIELFVGDRKECRLTNDDTERPCPPHLRAVVAEGGIRVNWTVANGSDSTKLYRSFGSGAFQLLGTFASNVTEYFDADVGAAGRYTYRVDATYGQRTSPGCGTVAVTIVEVPVFPGWIPITLAVVGSLVAFVLIRRRKP